MGGSYGPSERGLSLIRSLIGAMDVDLHGATVDAVVPLVEIERGDDGGVFFVLVHTPRPDLFAADGPIRLTALRDALRGLFGDKTVALQVKAVGDAAIDDESADGPKKVTFSCSFCGKNQKAVEKLIAGPGVYICNECIDLCNEIIAEELGSNGKDAKPSVQLRPVAGLSTEDALVELSRAAAVVKPVEPYIEEVVKALRARGVSWSQIGGALGMSRQGAWARYSGED